MFSKFQSKEVIKVSHDNPGMPDLEIVIPKTKIPKLEVRIPQWAVNITGTIFFIYCGANYSKKIINILLDLADSLKNR